jgi:hypothetical protein
MQQAKAAAEQGLRQLCQSLGLLYEPQDWGIINADARRLSEFIAYYEANPLSETQRFELGELILASANESLLANGSLPEALLPFLARNRGDLATQLEYWRNLGDGQEFPVGNWLRSNFSEPRRE